MDKIRVGIPSYDESKLGMITSTDMMTITNLISEPFLRLYDGKIWPALAHSWQTFEKGRRWLFYLSPTTLFNDSTPCTMADVMEAIEHVKAMPDEYGGSNIFNTYFKDFEFSILNRYALQAISPEPCGDLAEMLSLIQILKENRLNKWIIGTGNYKYATYWAEKSVRLTKLPGLKHLSAYSQITFFVIPDARERVEALRKGDIHIATDLESVASGENHDDNMWWTCKSNKSVMGMLNGFRPPFNQPLARRAVNLAVNVDRIIREVLDGYAVPSASIVSPYHCGYNSLLDPIPYDPALARKLFAQIDIDHELVITACRENPFRAFAVADMIAEMLNDVGLKVRVEHYDERQTYNKLLTEKNFGDIMLTWTSNRSTVHLLRDAISAKVKGRLWQGIEDDSVQHLIDEARAECDITDRERKYSRVITYLNRNPHWLYLYHPTSAYARTPDVDDVETLHTGELRFPGAW